MTAEQVSGELLRLIRLMHVFRHQLASELPAGLDWGAYQVLGVLVRGGPRRQRDVAELALLDPSTVSRHVAQLRQAGAVEREVDESDRRACLLTASQRGHELVAAVSAKRDAAVRRALAGWPPDDVQQLTALLARFTAALGPVICPPEGAAEHPEEQP